MAAMVLDEIYGAWRSHDLDRLASYLPDDFTHEIVLPVEMTPFGGLRDTKQDALARLEGILENFEVIRFDTSELMIQGDRAAVRVPLVYWHRPTGMTLESSLGSFWQLEEGWPVHLVEYHDFDRIRRFMRSVERDTALA